MNKKCEICNEELNYDEYIFNKETGFYLINYFSYKIFQDKDESCLCSKHWCSCMPEDLPRKYLTSCDVCNRIHCKNCICTYCDEQHCVNCNCKK